MKASKKFAWALVGFIAYPIVAKGVSYVKNNTKFGQKVTEKYNELKEQAEAKINEARQAACENDVNPAE